MRVLPKPSANIILDRSKSACASRQRWNTDFPLLRCNIQVRKRIYIRLRIAKHCQRCQKGLATGIRSIRALALTPRPKCLIAPLPRLKKAYIFPPQIEAPCLDTSDIKLHSDASGAKKITINFLERVMHLCEFGLSFLDESTKTISY